MKIVFIVPEISKTGGMRVIFEYANRLSAKGHLVTLVSPIIPFNPYEGDFKWFYFKYRIRYALDFYRGKIAKPGTFFKQNFNIKYIPFAFSFFVPVADIYIATSWTTSFFVNILNAESKKFYLVQDYEVWNSNKALVDKSYKLPLKKIVVSTYLKNILKEKFDEESEVVLNGIDFNKFNNQNEKTFEVKTILFMDHSLENKNTEDALKVIEKIHSEYPDIKIKCFGRENYSNVPEYVSFIKDPSDKEIVNLYRSSDIFLYTSMYEGFALPPAEAMACKCAVAGYNSAALPDYSLNEETALLCEAGDTETLYNNVIRLINNLILLEKISMGGYNQVRKVLDWNSAETKFEKIILA